MWHRCKNNCAFLPSRLARALWIEIFTCPTARLFPMSRLARALWIEIGITTLTNRTFLVEARESPVDRNFSITPLKCILKVEARESPVDRNPPSITCNRGKPCRGSREPCGSKYRHASSSARKFRRGSREPCGSK